MYRVFFTLVLAISFMACQNNTSPSQNGTASKAPVQSKLTEKQNTALLGVLQSYYGLKDAFVSCKWVAVNDASKKLATNLDSFQAQFPTPDSNAWLPMLDSIHILNKSLLDMNDTTCELKRVPFSSLSDKLYAILKAVQIKNAGIYQQHCPMAFDDKGANWLSNESEIKNPYFGKKMLECGDLTDSLK